VPYVVLAMTPVLAFYAVAERQLIGGLSTDICRSVLRYQLDGPSPGNSIIKFDGRH
jgi:hypothetical protein